MSNILGAAIANSGLNSCGVLWQIGVPPEQMRLRLARERQEATLPQEGQKGFQPVLNVPLNLAEHKPKRERKPRSSKPKTSSPKARKPRKRNPEARKRETRSKLANVARVGHDTIQKVKKIEEKATEEEKAKLVSGEATINQRNWWYVREDKP